VTQPTCSILTDIKVTTPVNGDVISYTLTGINPVLAAISNTTGIFSGLVPGTYELTTTNITGCTSLATSNII
jgi:hypothetical protein